MLGRIVSVEDLLKHISKHILSSHRLRKQHASPLVLMVEQDHRKLLQARFFDPVVLLGRLQNVGDVLDSKARVVVVRVNQV